MSITPEEIERIAELASLAIDTRNLPELSSQIADILEYVAQIDSVVEDKAAEAFRPGPAATPLADDTVNPVPLNRSPESIAPEFRHGLFIVPQLGALGGDGE